MGEKVASPFVAKMIGDWYGYIKKQDILKAENKRKEIVKAFENMEEDQNVLLYFNLIDSRYKMMAQEFEGSKDLLKQIDIEEKQKTDDMIQYYYFFFNGMYEFYKNRFSDAINYYHIAETRLRNVPDELIIIIISSSIGFISSIKIYFQTLSTIIISQRPAFETYLTN
ncbi:RapH N-terminal domain-containing protein [Bacillus xiamenensis]|uniref:response regulator aspartate phosphatase n=1 Tax=Bacillus xiamenensis TaxID=1178537 RepID=UPI00028C605C|nr:RapH N-terminal domain-containing protein [Bacillus xiamenensis]EKF35639.1 Response regulator aspartate phosphatase J [Bacillus xiamenensis]